MEKETLSIEIREEKGKGFARRLRAEHKVPASVYGKSFEPIKASVVENELKNIINHGTRVLEITLSDDSKHTAILKEVQYDPVNNAMIHVDFQVVKDDEEFKISVPIKLQNVRQAHGVKMGGQLIQQSYRLDIKTNLANLPEEIDVDVTKLGNSESIIVRNLPQESYKILSHPTVAICSISKAKAK